MVRIWAKICKGEKILKDTIYEEFNSFDLEKFFDYIASICSSLDIGTPVILSKHIFHYLNFNNASFTKADFTEEIDFDKLVIEEASNY